MFHNPYFFANRNKGFCFSKYFSFPNPDLIFPLIIIRLVGDGWKGLMIHLLGLGVGIGVGVGRS